MGLLAGIYIGLIICIITMLALNIFITHGATFGWTSIATLFLAAVTIIGTIVFVRYELTKTGPLIDFKLLENKAYIGVTISNFLLNTVAGTLVVANTYVQVARGFAAFQAGILSIGYLVAVSGMILIGEKILQKIGTKNQWYGVR